VQGLLGKSWVRGETLHKVANNIQGPLQVHFFAFWGTLKIDLQKDSFFPGQSSVAGRGKRGRIGPGSGKIDLKSTVQK